jgi:hypothetical protein
MVAHQDVAVRNAAQHLLIDDVDPLASASRLTMSRSAARLKTAVMFDRVSVAEYLLADSTRFALIAP